MTIKKLQFRICQILYPYQWFSYCPLIVIFFSVARIIIALSDIWKILRYSKFSNAKSWYYDRTMYSESIVATCFSHTIVIISLNALLLIGILKADENSFPYPWMVVEFIEIILQAAKFIYAWSFRIGLVYGLVWKFNFWLVTSCLVLGKTCITKETLL